MRPSSSVVAVLLAAVGASVAAVGGPQHRNAAGSGVTLRTAPQIQPSSSNSGMACDFERPCSWQWKNNTTPPGFNVVSGKLVNNSFYSAPLGNFTGPTADFSGSNEGQFFTNHIFQP